MKTTIAGGVREVVIDIPDPPPKMLEPPTLVLMTDDEARETLLAIWGKFAPAVATSQPRGPKLSGKEMALVLAALESYALHGPPGRSPFARSR